MDHQVIAPSVFGFAALALLPFCFTSGNSKKMRSLGCSTVVVMLFFALPLNIPLAGIPPLLTYPALLLGNVADTVARLPQAFRIMAGHSSIAADYAGRMEQIKEKNKLPQLDGTVDLLPTEISVILANGYDYHPRPVIQSYLAYQQSLLRLNDDYFHSEKSPDYVILQNMTDIYDYYPALHDGPSWLNFLSFYRPFSCQSAGLVLKKSPGKVLTLRLKKTINADLGQAISLDDCAGKIIFAKVNVSVNPLGSLQKLFFRIYPPSISVLLKSGKSLSFVAPTEDLKGGFILSPFVCQPSEINDLYQSEPLPGLAENMLSSMTISERPNDFPWHILSPKYTIELFTLEQTP